MKKRKNKILSFFLICLTVIGVTAAGIFCAILWFAGQDKAIFADEQARHIAALEEASQQAGYAVPDEKEMTGFDPQSAANSDIRLNELQFLATHNSYKRYPNALAQGIMKYIITPLGFADGEEWNYSFDTLTQQFNHGVRSVELDVMREKDGFRCAHIPLIDYASTCPDFSLALKEINLWSQNNPGHLPITILIESKSTILSGGKLFHSFNMDDALLLETLLMQQFGERLYTPADMLGEYESFAQMRSDNAYPALSGLLGKIIAIYHYDARNTEAYVEQDTTMRTQKMFVSVQAKFMDANTAMDYSCFVIINDPSDSGTIREYMEQDHMLVRTRTDFFPYYDGEWREIAIATGAFLVSTDYPPRDDLRSDPYVFTFDDKSTVTLQNP